MSVWTTPVTWANTTMTATALNVEIRDHATWLKAALDLITGGTTADTGTGTGLSITRTSPTDVAFGARVSGDAGYQIYIRANGAIVFGDGAGTDLVNLYQNAPGRLVLGGTNAQFGIEQGSGGTARDLLFTWLTGDTQPRVALGLTAAGQGRMSWGDGSAAPDLFMVRDVAGRLMFSATGDSARIGTVLDGANESAAHFAWRTGDTIPRVSIGQEASGLPALRFSPGSGGTYETLYRESAGIIATDSVLKLTSGYVQSARSAAANSYFLGMVTGDTGPRIRLTSTAGGSGSILFSDGTVAAGSEDVNLFRGAAARLDVGGSTVSFNLTGGGGGTYMYGGTSVVGSRKTGWTNATGTPTRTTFVTSTVLLPALAEHVKALIDDLMTHGLLGA